MLRLFKQVFTKYPFHILLLPVFFIISKYVQYQGLLEIKEVFTSSLIIAAILAVFLLLNFFYLKNFLKSAIAATCCGFIFLFFGDLRVFLQKSSFLFISTYKFLLPILVLLFIAFFIVLRKSEKATKTTSFLNLLLFFFTITELSELIQLKRNNYQGTSGNVFTTPVPDKLKSVLPDIYYIVPDCYPSSSYQMEMLNTSNTFFDSELIKRGFNVLPNSRSNYNRTAFSMLGTFGMEYISWLHDKKAPGAAEYNRAISYVKFSPLFEFFQKNGYSLINLSIFDLAANPSLHKEKFLSATTSEMIFSFTFWNYFSKDILYSWVINKKETKKNSQRLHYNPLKKYAKQIVDSLVVGTMKSFKQHQFVYAHLSFPHFPYFYDSSGRSYSDESLYTDSLITDRKKFAGYIKYSNQQLLQIVSSILKRTNGDAIILIQSDHGLSDLDVTRKNDAFRNYSAFYFPDKDYSKIYDSMSNVNTFRILLNKYFGQQFPLLKDSSVYVPLR